MSKQRPRAFWFHYNKPASSKAGAPRLTLHYKGVCHIVSNVSCNVPSRGRLRKAQPRFVMCGFGIVRISKNGMAVITHD